MEEKRQKAGFYMGRDFLTYSFWENGMEGSGSLDAWLLSAALLAGEG